MNKGVLILAGGRVGGSNLMKAIAKGIRSTIKYEMDIINDWKLINPTSDVCKYVPFYDHTDLNYNYEFKEIANPERVIELAKQFSKIVIMNRRDKVQQTDSLYALKVINNNKNFVHWNDSNIDKESNLYKNLYRYNLEMDKCLKYFSDKLSIKMDYYEDVYEYKTLNDKSIILDYKYFGKVNKLRRSISNKTVI